MLCWPERQMLCVPEQIPHCQCSSSVCSLGVSVCCVRVMSARHEGWLWLHCDQQLPHVRHPHPQLKTRARCALAVVAGKSSSYRWGSLTIDRSGAVEAVFVSAGGCWPLEWGPRSLSLNIEGIELCGPHLLLDGAAFIQFIQFSGCSFYIEFNNTTFPSI